MRAARDVGRPTTVDIVGTDPESIMLFPNLHRQCIITAMAVHGVDGRKADTTDPCPCCRYMTLTKNSPYRVCPVCLWEDDGQADHDADQIRDGFNGISLTQARFNFLAFGAYDEASIPFARRPKRDERPTN